MRSKSILTIAAILLAAFFAASIMGCGGDKTVINIDFGEGGGGGDDDDTGDDDTGDDDTGESDFEVVRSAAESVVTGENAPYVIGATDLHDLLNDGDDGNDPFLVDLRSADDYSSGTYGHIYGTDGAEAVNIGFTAVAGEIDTLPTDQGITVYCYTGHTASMTAMWLLMLGYDAHILKFGMMGWNPDKMGDGKSPFDPDTAAQYDVCTGTQDLTDEYEFPTIDTGEDNAHDIIFSRAEAVLQDVADAGSPPIVKTADLDAWLNDDDPSTDFFIVDIRSSADYETAHICGSDAEAYNIGYADIFNPDNLKYLPTDMPIAVYCYTGHTCSQVTFALRMLGYDAYSIMYGMMGWDWENMGDGKTPFDPDTAPDYETTD